MKNEEKKSPKRCVHRTSKENKNLKQTIPIFIDEFLDLFRKQKSEILSCIVVVLLTLTPYSTLQGKVRV
jgi:hypothetical protein